MGEEVVELSYGDLLNPLADLGQSLQQAYGADSLGILTVSGVPNFHHLRTKLLHLSQSFAVCC